jgi:hypothetical protein
LQQCRADDHCEREHYGPLGAEAALR